MIEVIYLTADTLEERMKRIEEFGNRAVKTNITALNDVFGTLYRGSLYSICACRGTGKSTFLLASAKKMAETGKVIYITIEQSYEQLGSYLPKVSENLVIVMIDSDAQLQEVYKLIEEIQPEAVFFDYLGALLTTWDDLTREAHIWAEMAKKLGILIFTANQADDKLHEEWLRDPKSISLNTGMYVSFSKHMIDKVAGAAYLVNMNNQTNMYCFKNRYNPLRIGGVNITGLDYKNKEWQPIVATNWREK